MNKEQIDTIFNTFNIKIKSFKSAKNSFNSNVYIINSLDNKKYVLKFCNSESKMLNESKYMKYLKKYLPVSEVIGIGNFEGNYYIIQSFFDGENIYDENANNLSDKQIKNIGILLAKLHSCNLLDKESNSWIEYLQTCLNKTGKTLEGILGKDNFEIINNYLCKYIETNINHNYKNSILHMDFRIGNIIFSKKNTIGLIDLESMKNGEYVFDFVKMNRIFKRNKFKLFLEGYSSIRQLEKNFKERLNFYSLFDSYTSLWWCISKKQTNSDFYKLNYSIVLKYLESLKKNGKI